MVWAIAVAWASPSRAVDVETMRRPRHLVIDAVCGSVDVIGRPDAPLHIQGHVPEAADVKVLHDRLQTTLQVVPRSACAALEIVMPGAGSLTVDGVSPAVTVRGLSSTVEIRLVGGAVNVERTQGAEISTVSGPVSVTGVTGRIDVETVSGTIDVQEPAGPVDLRTVRGDVTVAGHLEDARLTSVSGALDVFASVGGDGTVTARTHAGPIGWTLPAGAGATFAFTTVQGALEVDERVLRPSRPGGTLTLARAGGGPTVSLETTTGRATLRTRSATDP